MSSSQNQFLAAMFKKLIIVAFFAILTAGSYSQRPTLELTFTAVNSSDYVQLDSIKILNRSQGGETTVYWPDTTCSIQVNPGNLLLCVGYTTFYPVGFQEVNNGISSFELYQNHPNPMVDKSEISMFIPMKGKVHFILTDLQGKVILRTDRQLGEGYHSFMFIPGGGSFYFLTVQWNGISRSIKMVSSGQKDGKTCRLEYVGGNPGDAVLKESFQVSDLIVRQSGILDSPEEDTTYTFQFATNIPCPGTPTVEYEGQVYNTIQVFSQCWLKENLNVGTMIFGTEEMSDNNVMEKYCYENDPDSCTRYGGLYQWWEMMQYSTEEGTRGICPPGWHLPTDEELKVLEGAVDSQYGIGDPQWDLYWEFRGLDAGLNLKTTNGWNENGNGTDLFGFSGLPGGNRVIDGSFGFIGVYGNWWTSTQTDDYDSWNRLLSFYGTGVGQNSNYNGSGFSVRCLRN